MKFIHFSTTLLLYTMRCISSDNPTAIVPPMNISDPGYLLAESDGGLGNRLRVLAAYMYIGKVCQISLI